MEVLDVDLGTSNNTEPRETVDVDLGPESPPVQEQAAQRDSLEEVRLSPGAGTQEEGVLDVDLGPDPEDPTRFLEDDSEPVRRARQVKEDMEGDFFGLVDNEDLSRVTSFFTSLGESASQMFVEELPKTSAGVMEMFGGPDIRRKMKVAAKRSREEDIDINEALKRMEEEQGAFGEFFAGQAGTTPSKGDLKNNLLHQAGSKLGEFTEELFPENPEFRDEVLARQAPEMIGMLAGFYGGGAFAGATRSGSSLLSRATAQNLAASGLGSSSQAVRQYKEARRNGASQQEAMEAFTFGLATGTLEGLPIAAGLKRIDRITGGSVTNALERGAVNTVKGVIEEGAQEGITQYLTNLGVSQIYDETRDLWSGVGTAMAIGGALGGTVNAIGTGLANKMSQAETTQEAAQVAEAQDFMRRTANFEALGEAQDITQDRNLFQPTGLVNTDLRAPDPGDISVDDKAYSVHRESATDKIRRGFLNWFSARGRGRGVLPQSAHDLVLERDGKIAKELTEMENNIRLVEQGLKEEFGVEEGGLVGRFFSSPRAQEIPDEVYERINAVLTTRGLPSKEGIGRLPENIREPVKRMREHVDRLSRALIDEGIAQGDLEMKIKKNIGTYLTRTYKRQDYADWENFLFQSEEGDRIINNAKSYIVTSYKDKYGIDPRDPDSDVELNQLVREILDNREDPFQIFQGGDKAAEGIDWDVLTKRDRIAEPIRALMGERKDGVVNYARSVQKMSNLLESYRYQEEFRQVGLEEGWLHRPGEFVPEAEKIVPDNTKIYDPLTDDSGRAFQADKDVAEAFNHGMNVSQAAGKIGEWFARINGLAKISKTALNQGTHLDNTIGASIMFAQNGHLPNGPAMREAWQAVSQNLSRAGREDVDLLLEAEEFRLTGGGAISGEIRALAQDVRFGENGIIGQLTIKQGRGRGHPFGLQSLSRRGTEGILDIYQASDDLFRIALWRKEMRQLADARFDKPLEDLDARQEASVKEEAADIARNQFQNYRDVPKIISEARKLPFTNFLSFQYEAARTSINTVRRARQEIQPNLPGRAGRNPKMFRIGMKRLASAMTAYSGALFKGAAKAGAAMAGISIAGDAMEDLREHMAPWDKNGILMPTGKEERRLRGNKYTFYNLSQHDPYTILNGPIRAAYRGATRGELKRKLMQSLQQQTEPLFSHALVAQALLDIRDNETQFGGKIHHEGASWGEAIAADMWHFWESMEPGLVKAGREVAAQSGLEEPLDIDFASDRAEAGDPLATTLGLRASQVDPDRSLDFALNDLEEEIRDQQSEFAGVRATENLSEVVDEMEESNRQYQRAYDKASRKVWSAYRLGVPLERINQKFDESSISNDVQEQIMRGFPGRLIDLQDIIPEE